jgi:hypothetical protein
MQMPIIKSDHFTITLDFIDFRTHKAIKEAEIVTIRQNSLKNYVGLLVDMVDVAPVRTRGS